MSQLFASGGQNIGVSVCISPSSEYSELISFRIDWFDLLAARVFSKTTVQRQQLFGLQPFYCLDLTSISGLEKQ